MKTYIPFKWVLYTAWMNISWSVYHIFSGNQELWPVIAADVNFICWMIIFAREFRNEY